MNAVVDDVFIVDDDDDAAMSQTLAVYTLVYALIAWCLVLPPTEFISAGLTIDSIFGGYYGPGEAIDFVKYHVRRTTTNVVAHSFIPLVYFFTLDFLDVSFNVHTWHGIQQLTLVWKMLFFAAFVPIVVAALVAIYWTVGKHKFHPIIRALAAYDDDWQSVVTAINTEYRRFDKFAVNLGGVRRLIVTDSWIIWTSTYTVKFAQQQDIAVKVVASDEHVVSHHSVTHEHDIVQFLNIEVSSTNAQRLQPKFVVRLNARDYRDLTTKLSTRVTVARDVMIQNTTSERFVHAFTDVVEQNGPIELDSHVIERLDACLGCGVVMANVKLQRHCDRLLNDENRARVDADGQPVPECIQCYCRPMWCVACMARWFALRQLQARPDQWLAGKAPCPTCRATFCMLDVRRVSNVGALDEQ